MTHETTEAKFTPAPWLVYGGPMNMKGGLNPFFRGIVALIKSAGDDDDIAVILDRNEAAHDFRANANLIAAAPDLYAALDQLAEFARSVRHDFGNQHDMNFEPSLATAANRMAHIAESALAKARGEAVAS